MRFYAFVVFQLCYSFAVVITIVLALTEEWGKFKAHHAIAYVIVYKLALLSCFLLTFLCCVQTCNLAMGKTTKERFQADDSDKIDLEGQEEKLK